MLHKILTLSALVLLPVIGLGQLANSNYGLRSQMGITLNQQYSSDYFEKDGDRFRLDQHSSNFQTSFPLMLNIDTSGAKTKVRILSNQFTFRNVENRYMGVSESN
jgi:hypothetical protein